MIDVKRGFGIADENEEHPGIGQEAVAKIACVYLQLKNEEFLPTAFQ
jgi:hypothetical protein